MKRIMQILLLIILAATVAGCASDEKQVKQEKQQNPSVEQQDEQQEKTPAPEFTLVDLEGRSVNLSDFRGKYVFLNFWGTNCRYCVAEMPNIQKLYEKYGNDVAIVGINIGEKPETVKNFMEKNGYNFPILLDRDGEVSAQYLVRYIPTTYIISPQGEVVTRVVQAMHYSEMENLLKKSIQK